MSRRVRYHLSVPKNEVRVSRRVKATVLPSRGIAFWIIAIAAVACGSAAKSVAPAGSPTAAGDQSFLAAANNVAGASLLVLTDMPQGWTSTAHTSDSSDPHDVSARCQPLAEDAPPNAAVAKTSDDFHGPRGGNVSAQVAVYLTADLADSSMRQLGDLVLSCTTELATFLKDRYPKFDDLTVSAQERSVTGLLLARVFGLTISGHAGGKSRTLRADLGYVVTGRMASSAIVELTDDSPKTESLLALMSQRAAAAEALLLR